MVDDPHKTSKFMLNGFFKRVYPLDYAEEYLGFLYMWETWGRGGGHQFIRHITIEGMAWDAAIIKVSRMTLEDFNSAAFNFAYQAILDLHEQVKKRRRKRSQKSRRPSLSRRKTLIPSDGGFFFVGIYCRAQSLRPQSSETVAGTTTLQLPAFYRNSPF